MNVQQIEVMKHRAPQHEVHRLLVSRWSPRAMSGEGISDEELASLFEAARWAPSSYNAQPWRFLYAQRGSRHWPDFLDLLVEANRRWAEKAAVLIVILSRTTFERNDKPSRTHSFDTGAAWQNLALQGTALGLVVHGMEGFDYDRARRALNVPSGFDVEAMAAVGRPGEVDETPSGRKEIGEIAREGPMPGNADSR